MSVLRQNGKLLWALWVWPVVWSVAIAEAPRPVVTLRALKPLQVGQRAELTVHLWLPEGTSPSLLVSIDAEGAAVDVVRGRLMRGDADDPEARPLSFRVPLVARGEGQSVVRVRVDVYVCSPRCRPRHYDARTVVEVRRE